MIADRSVMTVIAPSHLRCSACLDVCHNDSHVKRFIASEARKAVGLMRSLAIPQLRVSVYDVTIRNTYRDPESCHRPTCGTTISLNVRTTSVLEDFFRR